MNGLDILLMILLAWGAYSAFKKGFITALVATFLSILGFIKGVPLFYTLLPMLEAMHNLVLFSSLLPLVLALVMFLVGGLFIYVTTKLIKCIVTITLLGIFDGILGGLLGFFQSASLISLLIYCYNCSNLVFLSTLIDKSTLVPMLEPIVPKFLQVVF
ncbi:MAG: CvpA family protein [Amoebophilaceae bacterium]|nr:CvpA family protein [Amoebophilaceae bacterium]